MLILPFKLLHELASISFLQIFSSLTLYPLSPDDLAPRYALDRIDAQARGIVQFEDGAVVLHIVYIWEVFL